MWFSMTHLFDLLHRERPASVFLNMSDKKELYISRAVRFDDFDNGPTLQVICFLLNS